MRKIVLNEKELVQEYIEGGLTLEQLAEKYSCSIPVIQRRLREAGARKRKEIVDNVNNRNSRKAAFASREELYDLYIVQNLSAESIARIKNISKAGVQKYLKKYKITKSKDQISEVVKKGCLEKYGVVNVGMVQEFREKAKETYRRKTGYDSVMKDPTVIAKILNTKGLERRPVVRKGPKKVLSKEAQIAFSSREALLSAFDKIESKTLYNLSVELKCGLSTVARKVREYGLRYLIDNSGSKEEEDIKKFLAEHGIECERNREVIYPREIDLYNSEYRIGIEFNGNYWHSEDKVGKFYHLDKTKEAIKQGVFLYHIFEYEWEDEFIREKIKSQLLNLFHRNSQNVYARKCELKEISSQEAKQFLEDNHLQGKDNSAVRVGLFYEGELVSLMTFGKPRFARNYQWELYRFCSKRGMNVVGAASKLFNFFTCHHQGSIISYSNASKTTGSLYEKLGFELSHWSAPGYVWVDGRGNFIPRYRTQMKHESEVMHQKGYYRVYDCGNKVWIYENRGS